MYAIVDVKDKQFKVRESDTLYVPYHADAEVDDTLTLDRVLLLSDGEGDVTLGTPTVENASVVARVVDQVQGDKVLVFKKKRRKRYRVKRGHRQQYTQIEITALHTGNGASTAEAADATDTEPEEEAPESVADTDEAATEATTEAEASEEATTEAETAAEETAADGEDAPEDDESATDESDEGADEKSGA